MNFPSKNEFLNFWYWKLKFIADPEWNPLNSYGSKVLVAITFISRPTYFWSNEEQLLAPLRIVQILLVKWGNKFARKHTNLTQDLTHIQHHLYLEIVTILRSLLNLMTISSPSVVTFPSHKRSFLKSIEKFGKLWNFAVFL